METRDREWDVTYSWSTTVVAPDEDEAMHLADEDYQYRGQYNPTVNIKESSETPKRRPVFLTERTLVSSAWYEAGTCFIPCWDREGYRCAHPDGGDGWVLDSEGVLLALQGRC